MNQNKQLTGMRGVYLIASELSMLGFLAAPTSQSAIGADILVTDQNCKRTYSVQVKTNAKTFGFWLVGKKVNDSVSDSHVYVLVNIRNGKSGEKIDYYIVPSSVVASKTVHSQAKTGANQNGISLICLMLNRTMTIGHYLARHDCVKHNLPLSFTLYVINR